MGKDSKKEEKTSRYEYFTMMFGDNNISKNKAIKYDGDIVRNALNRAHDIRKFEINLYWERSKYMYVMVGAIFVGIYSIDDKNTIMPIFLSFIGMIFSFAWVLINKGSRYWQENWESHIDCLEDDIDGKLYKIVNETNHASDGFSVSKINIFLSSFVFICFTFLLFYYSNLKLNITNIMDDRVYWLFAGLGLLVLVLFLINIICKRNIFLSIFVFICFTFLLFYYSTINDCIVYWLFVGLLVLVLVLVLCLIDIICKINIIGKILNIFGLSFLRSREQSTGFKKSKKNFKQRMY